MKFLDFIPSVKKEKSSGRQIYTNYKIIQRTEKFKPEKSKNKTNFSQVLFFITLFLIIFFIYLLFYSSYFSIKNIDLIGDYNDSTVEYIQSINGKNIFRFGSRKIKKDIKEKLPIIKDVKVVVGFPNTLKIFLKERDTELIWETQGRKYLVDKEGVVFAETEKIDIKRIQDEKNLPIKLGDKLVSNELTSIIRSIEIKLPAILSEEIDHFGIGESLFVITVYTKSSKRVIFYTQVPLAYQLTVLDELVKKDKENIKEYVDLRVEGYGYYK
ncbi:MAG: hypothetical protein UR93_C0006G0027 [Berkelbacteria bacterium GW2011_GWA2_35_9]|uniref:Uncharacterized protein n=1 Tax=Berkelbacteria bacterium GW2011_GWA2_35_9 TaxID=1618333 RepID=A0A0G0D3W1_9BACT|nr:MAG: hypothetical protein UR93_C0006G0027 [Berkelbacteria bacterium GW2011_GWA2_35_9]